ncbi:unnamed protein product [Moneuplotes crassus]|uniref:Uncharacterized protein n=1 Tax=Euplotes crassus TaxID=5936 RepID=A0AAD2D2Q8_EUPCR|nr:unnamed protein product [Moneuplotes crassus]
MIENRQETYWEDHLWVIEFCKVISEALQVKHGLSNKNVHNFNSDSRVSKKCHREISLINSKEVSLFHRSKHADIRAFKMIDKISSSSYDQQPIQKLSYGEYEMWDHQRGKFDPYQKMVIKFIPKVIKAFILTDFEISAKGIQNVFLAGRHLNSLSISSCKINQEGIALKQDIEYKIKELSFSGCGMTSEWTYSGVVKFEELMASISKTNLRTSLDHLNLYCNGMGSDQVFDTLRSLKFQSLQVSCAYSFCSDDKSGFIS